VLGALQWLPVAIAPLVLAQRFGATGLIRTSALFLYLRRQLRRDPSMRDRLLDISGPYAALLVLSAGAANERGPGYFIGLAVFTAFALYMLRPRAAPLFAFVCMLTVSVLLGYGGHIGLNRLQATVEAWVDEWLVMLPVDVERTTTRMGSIGRLKQHDAIAMRVYGPHKESHRFKLLHAASFNEYRGGTWLARRAGVEGTHISSGRVAIVLRVQGGKTPLPVPLGTTGVALESGLAAQVTGLGVLTVDAPPGWLRYDAAYGDAGGTYPAPGPADLAIPATERDTLERLAPRANVVAELEKHFSSFTYSIFRERAPQQGMTALEDFLLHSKSGHCEYFASATTLLLRAAGIPARYATGYAVFEYSDLEHAWVVRARHAHAWSRAFIDGRWVDVDLTPATWPETESELRPVWERLADLGRWAAYLWTTRTLPDATALAWMLGIILIFILGWQLRRRRAAKEVPVPRREWGGKDSEFYAVAEALARQFRPRAPHEPLRAWMRDIGAGKPALELLELHYRYRFDPRGLAPGERARLRDLASSGAGEASGLVHVGDGAPGRIGASGESRVPRDRRGG
jgi:protein-glutamine gamma-glutamyltransferase